MNDRAENINDFQKGDKVFCFRYGIGEVIHINKNDEYQVTTVMVSENNSDVVYTFFGFWEYRNLLRSLYHIGSITFDDDGDPVAIDKHYRPKREAPAHVFKAGDAVLGRDDDDAGDDTVWRYDFYSHKRKGTHYCIGSYWDKVIPYEGNEHLVGTTDEPTP